MTLPQFDELHIISDLHMGGRGNFQIFKETEKLAAYIDWVRKKRTEKKIALVLNGDAIDTLAEDDSGYIAINSCIEVVGRIMEDPSFAPVWKSLSQFVKTERRFLIFVLGNHDLELAFSAVQRFIRAVLCGDNLNCQARLEFSTTGAGFCCLIGSSKVFCTHGNEVDPWNYTRYEDLSKASRRINISKKVEIGEWEPCAGTMLVKNIMNDVKKDYPWIDLLKPETKAALSVLLAIDPEQLRKVGNLLPVLAEKTKGELEVNQRLSSNGFSLPDRGMESAVKINTLLGPLFHYALFTGNEKKAIETDAFIEEVEADFTNGSAVTDHYNEALGVKDVFAKFKSFFERLGMAECLRTALQDWLMDDPTFSPTHKDQTFRDIMKNMGPDIDFVVTGHTHLERAIPLGNNRYYYNCGTWIRLLRFTEKMLKDKESFTPVLNLLRTATMETIDAKKFDGNPFVLNRSTVICISQENGSVVGHLYNVHYREGKISVEDVK